MDTSASLGICSRTASADPAIERPLDGISLVARNFAQHVDGVCDNRGVKRPQRQVVPDPTGGSPTPTAGLGHGRHNPGPCR